MNRELLPDEEHQAQRYAAQPTAPSCDETRSQQDEQLAISWFGPETERIESVLSGDRLRIGRESDNDLVLGGTEVSRRHAEIVKVHGDFTIADKGSRNGVFVNERREQYAVLLEGSALRLGEWVGVVTRGGGGTFREVAPRLWGGTRLERDLLPLQRAARSRLNLVIAGETGTGKELVAKTIFDWSGLTGAFVPVNCAALSETMLESELFGHSRGAFTGAVAERLGHVREADGGILFLDEIAELPLLSQGKLLRVLQEQEVTPVGTSKRIPVRLRVIAASHRDLRSMVTAGTFRVDLLARLEGLVIRLPPLRARREDILPLFLDFARARPDGKSRRLSPELATALLLGDWPGNVRELKQLADRAAALHGDKARWGLAEVEPQPFRRPEPAEMPAVASPSRATRPPRPERHELISALTAARGIVVQAAKSLGVSKQTFYKLLEEHEIDIKTYRDSMRGS